MIQKRLLAIGLLLSVACAGSAQRHLSFDQGWNFRLGDVPGAEAPGYDDAGWRRLDLPHDWSIEGAFSKDAPAGGRGGYLPAGIGWYRKQWVLPKNALGKRVLIRFDGVYMNSEVWINGHSLGKRPNGYISFVYDLTPFLTPGKNCLAVRVDNSLQPNSRWYSGSGIYRHVWLDVIPPLHIGQWGPYITTPEVSATEAKVSVRMDALNEATVQERAQLTFEVLDDHGTIVSTDSSSVTVAAAASGEWTRELRVSSPRLWSVEAPNLYTLRAVLRQGPRVLDEYRTPFGIRTLSYSMEQGFLLNGARVKMDGVCLHHDGGCVGAAVPLAIWKERLGLLKAMGCNAIRTSHNPPAPEFLDLCDQMGFLVMDEAFDAWETGKMPNDYNLYFDEWSKRDVEDQVRRDRNHPSVVLWSAGNEIPDQTKDKGVELLKGLMATFHEEDPTRPVTTANDDIAADNGATKLAFLEAEDIVGYNYVDRWHERRELFYDEDRYVHPNWKMIGTESETVRQAPENSLGNDPAHIRANYTNGMIRAEQLWKFIAVRPFVIGDFMWTGVDYLGEAVWPSKSAYSGVIDRSDVVKDSYYFYQSQWTTIPMVHLLPHWNWAGREGQVIPVIAYTNCDSVELLLNGKTWGVKALEFPRPGNSGAWNKYDKPVIRTTTADLHLSWDVPYAPGMLKAVGYKGGQPVIMDSAETSGPPARLRIDASATSIHADGADVALLHISVLDAEGRIVPDATSALQFSVTGGARLVGADNGNPRDDRSFGSDTCRAFKGHAYGVICAGRKPGQVRVTVRSEGLPDASVDLRAD